MRGWPVCQWSLDGFRDKGLWNDSQDILWMSPQVCHHTCSVFPHHTDQAWGASPHIWLPFLIIPWENLFFALSYFYSGIFFLSSPLPSHPLSVFLSRCPSFVTFASLLPILSGRSSPRLALTCGSRRETTWEPYSSLFLMGPRGLRHLHVPAMLSYRAECPCTVSRAA